MRICIKIGGDLLANDDALDSIAHGVRDLYADRHEIFVVHGAGPQIDELAQKLSIPQTKVGGRRVTDTETLKIVVMALAGATNARVTSRLVKNTVRAVGISGWSGPTILAKKRKLTTVSGSDGKPVDFGYVGDITEIRDGLMTHLWRGGFVPVISPLGVTVDGNILNMNADTVAAELAIFFQVNHAFLLTNVPGVLKNTGDSTSRIEHMTLEKAKDFIANGVITGGMIPKVEEACRCIESGINHVHILRPDGRTYFPQLLTHPGQSGTVIEA